MRALLLVVLAAIVATDAAAQGYEFVLGPVALSVPAGFEGPESQKRGGLTLAGFRKPNPGTDTAALLQISLYEFGVRLADLPARERGNAAEKYLRELIRGIERRRSAFVLSPPTRLKLAGIPAARAAWRGSLNGQDGNGVMYCLVVGTQVVSLHTQDAGSAPTQAMEDAMKAIEGLRVNAGG